MSSEADDILRIVADPSRRRILQATWGRELAAGDIARGMPVTFGAVSQHLKVLRDAGLIDCRREGRHRYYQANAAKLAPLREVLQLYWTERLETLTALVEDSINTRKPKI